MPNSSSNNNNDEKNDDDRPSAIHYLFFLGSFVVLIVSILYKVKLASSSTESQWQRIHQVRPSNDDNCAVFVAPSTLTNGGWGLFAGKDFHTNEIVTLAPLFVELNPVDPVVYNSILKDYAFYTLVRSSTTTATSSSSASSSPNKKEDDDDDDDDDNNNDHKEKEVIPLVAVLLGYSMVANHHPDQPNVESFSFGERRQQHQDSSSGARSHGFVATRPIQAGEEIFTSYGSNGGRDWFQKRNFKMNSKNDIHNPNHLHSGQQQQQQQQKLLEDRKQKYCSKLYAGPGNPTFTQSILPTIPSSPSSSSSSGVYFDSSTRLLAPTDAGWSNVIATKKKIQPHEIIESVPGLLMFQSLIKETPLGPIVLKWQDLDPTTHQRQLQDMKKKGLLYVQYQGVETKLKPMDYWNDYNDLAILPLGSIGMVRRNTKRQTSSGSSAEDDKDKNVQKDEEVVVNCRLEIRSSLQNDNTNANHDGTNNNNNGNSGIIVDLIATREIDQGEILVLDIPSSATSLSKEEEEMNTKERFLLVEELRQTGQPMPWLELVQDLYSGTPQE